MCRAEVQFTTPQCFPTNDCNADVPGNQYQLHTADVSHVQLPITGGIPGTLGLSAEIESSESDIDLALQLATLNVLNRRAATAHHENEHRRLDARDVNTAALDYEDPYDQMLADILERDVAERWDSHGGHWERIDELDGGYLGEH
jgi:hypothetical protein